MPQRFNRLVGRRARSIAVLLAAPVAILTTLPATASAGIADSSTQAIVYDVTGGAPDILSGQTRSQVDKSLGLRRALEAQPDAGGRPSASGLDASLLPAPTATYDPNYDPARQNAFRRTTITPKAAVNATSAIDAAAQAQGGYDFNACKNNPRGSQGDGVVLNHWNYCSWRTLVMVIFVNGKSEGTIKFDRITVGAAQNGQRAIDISTTLRNFVFTGLANQQALLTVYMSVGGATGPNGNPAPSYQEPPASTLSAASWDSNFASWRLTTSASTGRGLDKISLGVFRPDVMAVQPGYPGTNWVLGQMNGGRWDSAPYQSPRTEGAIFDRVIPYWSFSKATPGAGDVAQHIEGAFQNPNATFPPKAGGGKVIPGNFFSFNANTMLHRSYNGYAPAVAAANRSAKDKACGQLPTVSGTQCDEFPFASTREGAGKGDGNFSVKRVLSGHNSKAGGLLSSWYASDRILHDDAFLVRIIP